MAVKPIKNMSQSLEELLRHLGLETKIKRCRVVELWPQIVGDKISEVTCAERVTGQTLHVRVKSMTWKTELIFHKRDILSRIDRVVGSDVVKEIRFF